VITVHALRGGGAAAGYYLQRDAGCDHQHDRQLDRENEHGPDPSGVGYYVNGRDEVGRWIGRGSVALGLTGGLTTDRGGALLAGLLDGQFGGAQLAGPVWRTREGTDGEPVRVDVRRAGYDVTFSAPKSVSVLLALGDQDVAGQVRQAHDAALADALGLLEQLAARAARGHQGPAGRAPRIGTQGLIGAAFEHTTSRALDPQLHTHVVLVNLVQGTDGRWSALDSRTLHLQATTASHLYQHRLRAELSARLGVSWDPVVRGVADIRGVPLPVRREFAQRRRQIEAALEHRGLEAASREAEGPTGRRRLRAAAQRACLATRPTKRHAPVATLREQWAGRGRAAGFGPDELTRLLQDRTRPPAQVDLDALADRVLGATGVTRERATFDQGTVLREICAQLPPGAQVSAGQILDLTRRLVRTPDVVPVVAADGPAFTTVDMLRTERAALELATRTGRQPVAAVPAAHAAQTAAALARSGLRPDQQRAALALLTSGRPVEVITGPAGSGKTAALRTAVQQWQQGGLCVTGTAVAAIAASGVQHTTGASSVSLARLLHHPDRHLPPSGGVLLVDEAGMIGTRTLHQLLQLTAHRGCKVVLVGDPEQLPELEAGGLFTALSRRPDTLHLDGHHRQRSAWEQHALTAWRAGDVEQALDLYEQHHRLHTADDPDQLRTRLVTDYLTRRGQVPDPFDVLALAGTREQVQGLNQQIRQRLLERGQLGGRALHITTPDGPRDYRVGDQVVVTRNDHQRQLLNGHTGTVSTVTPDGLTVSLRDGRQVRLDRGWLRHGHLEHGYAMTLHKAQGRTVTHALLLASGNASRELGYVGMSRGTHSNQLYLVQAEGAAHDCQASLARPRPAPGRARRERSVMSRVAGQELAIGRIASDRSR
jgi:conjugative relaxase-like TrwC/TraI family protein